MPPFIPTRLESSRPQSSTERESLFNAADKPKTTRKTLQDNKNFVKSLENLDGGSSLSDISSDEFEDVLSSGAKRRKVKRADEEEDDDEIGWEDAIGHAVASSTNVPRDLDLTLDPNDGDTGPFAESNARKKGPSKIEREIRVSTHRMHVQFLLFHNLSRSRWSCDSETQKTLLDQLPEQVRLEVEKWREDSGLNAKTVTPVAKGSASKKRKGKARPHEERSQRDWGNSAERQERGEPNMSAGDPIIRLLKCLSTYWRKKFAITAPGLRKQGYRSLPALEKYIASYRKGPHDLNTHGERINGIEGFREAARMSRGSRDIGAQMFTALLRGLGIEARLVASLQPIGFGWSKIEEARIQREKDFSSPTRNAKPRSTSSSLSDSDDESDNIQTVPSRSRRKPNRMIANDKRKLKGVQNSPEGSRDHAETILVEDSDDDSDDDESVIEVTLRTPNKNRAVQFDRDLQVPNYWTEAVSPITFRIYPVDSMVSKVPVITSSEYLPNFEPRGAKADKAKQVFAYVIAYSPDGTAKDVTTRYLKRHTWPGRTKGNRMPTEKIPLYNRNGKIKKYEEYDWFKTVMSGYERPFSKRTAVDDLEEESDLKRAKLEKKDINIREDTLQFYKTSAEFVLERHLRREEAIKPASKPVRTFVSGKGSDTKEEPVFRRQDVEVCRSGESWHKEGRAIKPGEHPLKMVPIRAVTLTRKREVEEAERDSGEKPKQGLYARNQTDWIIPPPIEDGRIPKNAYGNIDCFVPTMIPKGAVHIPLRKTVMICKKLGIDYAEAVTGFEFGNKMAVPVIEGVVVAQEHEDLVIDRWEEEEKERKIKEEGKREKMALGTWRKWLMGLRIIQRVEEEYGGDPDAHTKEALNPFTNQSKVQRGKSGVKAAQTAQAAQNASIDEEELGGGFVIDDDDDEDEEKEEIGLAANTDTDADQRTGSVLIEDMETEGNDLHRSLGYSAVDATSEHFDVRHRPPEISKDEEDSEPLDSKPRPRKRLVPPKNLLGDQDSVTGSTSRSGQKRKGTFSSPDSSKRKPVRSGVRRNAARHSKTAVKSPYFEHGSEEDSEASHEQMEESESEDDVERSLRQKRKTGTRSSRKTTRARKSVT